MQTPPWRNADLEAFRLIDQFAVDLAKLAGDGGIPTAWVALIHGAIPATTLGGQIPSALAEGGATGALFGTIPSSEMNTNASVAEWRKLAKEAVEIANSLLAERERLRLAHALTNYKRARGRPKKHREPLARKELGRPRRWQTGFHVDVLRTIEGIQKEHGLTGRGKDKAAAEIYLRRWAKKNGHSETAMVRALLKRVQYWVSDARTIAGGISEKNRDI
jgi:hypothetical protein